MSLELIYALGVPQTLKQWPSNHSVLFTIILFVLAALISVYSQDIKRFLHDWPNTKAKIRGMRQQRLQARLDTLNRLHDNSYQLLLFVVWKASKILFDMAVFGMVLFAISLYTKIELTPKMYLGYFIGSLVGLFGSIKETTESLHKYTESVNQIQAKLTASCVSKS